MRLIGLLLTMVIVGYLFYVLLGPGPKPIGSAGRTAQQADQAFQSSTGLPPTTKTTPAGIAIERARQVEKLANERTGKLNALIQSGGRPAETP